MNRASRNGLAALVLAGSVFLKVKINFHFYKKQVIKKSISVIFGLVGLIILSNRWKNHIKRCKIIGCPLIMLIQGILLYKKLSNKTQWQCNF